MVVATVLCYIKELFKLVLGLGVGVTFIGTIANYGTEQKEAL